MRIARMGLALALLSATPAYATTLNVSDFVLFANAGPVTINNGVQIHSGAVGTNGSIGGPPANLQANSLHAGTTITVGNGADISAGSTVTAGGDVNFGANAHFGTGTSVVAGGNFAVGNGMGLGNTSVTLGGTFSPGATGTPPPAPAENQSVSLPTLPTLPPQFTPGSSGINGPVSVAANGSGAPSAGQQYTTLTVGNGATLTLTPGDYHFTSVDIGANVNIDYNNLNVGPVNIYVDGNVTFGNGTDWALTGGDASKVYWELGGNLTVGANATVFGTIFASGVAALIGDEILQNGGEYHGQYLATGGITAGANTDFYLVPSYRSFSTDNVFGATPIPTALPLFGTGLGMIGLLGWRRKRKANARAKAVV